MSDITILLLEDEPELSRSILFALRKITFKVQSVTTIQDAQKLILKEKFSLFIFDRMLPDGDGAHYCSTIRKKGIDTPILILTAMGRVSDRVLGLDYGADDYLCKPFSVDELLARVKALLRRSNNQNQNTREDKIWYLDDNLFEVTGPNGKIKVTPLEFKLLSHLISQPGQTIKRDDLLKHVWGYRFLPQTRTVDYFMSRIRRKFEADPENPIHFKTIRGIGYRFDLN